MIIPRRISREREHHTGGACAHDSGCGTQVRQFAPQLHALSCDMSFCSFQHTHQHTHAALDDGAPCAMTLIIIGVSSAAAYHSLARTRSISAMCVYVYLCVDIPRHTCCAVGPPPNSWPPRDEMPPPPQRGRRASIHTQRRFCHFTHHVSKSMAVEIPCQRLQMCVLHTNTG